LPDRRNATVTGASKPLPGGFSGKVSTCCCFNGYLLTIDPLHYSALTAFNRLEVGLFFVAINYFGWPGSLPTTQGNIIAPFRHLRHISAFWISVSANPKSISPRTLPVSVVRQSGPAFFFSFSFFFKLLLLLFLFIYSFIQRCAFKLFRCI
jgi:hypothetical protein